MSNKANPIIQSWTANAKKWIKTIEKNEIASRQLVTNAAILKKILQYHPKKVLDVGCGEGWLVRTLVNHKIAVTGLDVTPKLIENAKSKGIGKFIQMSYETLTGGVFFIDAPFDLICINFALFENKKTKQLIKKLPFYLNQNGQIIIQTLHPFALDSDHPYKSGWRKESWKGLKRNFTQPYKWYFRTLEDWVKLFAKAGLKLVEMQEPIHPHSRRPVSVIFVLEI